jgi:hypothetical protein
MTRCYPWRLDFGVGSRSLAIEYQSKKAGRRLGFNRRYDTGLVAGATPCCNLLTATCAPTSITIGGQPAIGVPNTITSAPLTADQEFQLASPIAEGEPPRFSLFRLHAWLRSSDHRWLVCLHPVWKMMINGRNALLQEDRSISRWGVTIYFIATKSACS